MDKEVVKLVEQGRYSEAINLTEKILASQEKTWSLKPNRTDVALTLNTLAYLYSSIGNYLKAESFSRKALAIREKGFGPNHPVVATNLLSLGSIYNSLGDYSKAEPILKKALKIFEKEVGPNNYHVSRSLTTLGSLYKTLGDYSKAEPLLKRAIAIRKKVRGDKNVTVLSGNPQRILASLYIDIGDYSKAEPLLKSELVVEEKVLGLDHPYVVRTRTTLADLYIEEGKLKEAYRLSKGIEYFYGLARYHLIKGDYEEAEKEFIRVVEKVVGSGIKESLIGGYIGLGLTFEGQNKYDLAKVNFCKAIDLIEEQWMTLSLSAREHFLSGKLGSGFSRLEAYSGMIRILLKEKSGNYEKEALSYAERIKSRLFLEMLVTRGVGGKGKEDQRVLAQDRKLQEEIALLRGRLSVLEELGSKAPVYERRKIEEELGKRVAEYEQFIKEVKLQDTELASLISVESSPIERLQLILEPDTTLIEYFSTNNSLYVWLVTKDDIRAYEIALNEKDLIKKVDGFLLPNISNRSRKAEPMITLAAGEDYKKEVSEGERKVNREKFLQVASDLYQSILALVEKDIKTDKLIIVPHGVLHKVPFSALHDGSKYLIDKYSISVFPAASVIEYVIKKRKSEKEKLLVLANPQTDYVSLVFAEVEAKILSAMFPQNEVYYREKATETMAKKRASDFHVIHFATHGEFNDRQPLQSGLLLARDGENDGFLQVHEVFGMDLANANLVTLSACETALSKIQGGDDLIGLSRGFFYAGAPSLLATLWKVDDASTAKLMEFFYKNWQGGMSKPEALRRAQITLKAMPQYKHPFYWAPFVMIGDWK